MSIPFKLNPNVKFDFSEELFEEVMEMNQIFIDKSLILKEILD